MQSCEEIETGIVIIATADEGKPWVVAAGLVPSRPRETYSRGESVHAPAGTWDGGVVPVHDTSTAPVSTASKAATYRQPLTC